MRAAGQHIGTRIFVWFEGRGAVDARVVFVENSPSVGAREACVRAIYSISTRNELDTLSSLCAKPAGLFIVRPSRQPTVPPALHPNISYLRSAQHLSATLLSPPSISTPEAPTMAAAAQSCRPLLEAGSYACFVVYIQADAHVSAIPLYPAPDPAAAAISSAASACVSTMVPACSVR